MDRPFAALLLLGALVPGLAGAAPAQDRSKKAYELIYEDVQALKLQVSRIQARSDQSAQDLARVVEQLAGLADLLRKGQAAQESVQDDLRAVPAQVRALAERIDQMALQLARIQTDLEALRAAGPAPAGGTAAAPNPSKPAGAAAETPPPPANPPEAGAPPAAAEAASPQEVYTSAYNDYLKGNYDLAVQGFRLYLDRFPGTPLSANAIYWIGECFYSQRMFAEAIEQFNEIILAYPNGDKAPAAYLKKGMSYAELGRRDEALAAFKLLLAKHPQTEEARLAQEKIKELSGT